ncbi:MAG: hypothetical protein WEB87_00765, partial [Bacteriovoracaceae bacterium]
SMNCFKPRCPRSNCQETFSIRKDGTYFRKNDSRKVQRYKCVKCGTKFSRATFQLEYRQKKRRVNFPLFKLLVSQVSQRRCALILGLNKNTVARKFDYLAKKYGLKNQRWLKGLATGSIDLVQLDDLITIEHTKLKPVTVATLVDATNRQILGFQVGKIPAFGHLAHISRRKYGKRENQHLEVLERLFEKTKSVLNPNALIVSDQHKNYPDVIKKYLPQSTHQTHRSERGRIDAQGELKRVEFDPLFAINHTYAMMRANINRLIRKTWCTTKSVTMLQQHLELYMWFHNQVLIKQ